MTALATILGLLPLSLGFGEGNETMVPLARAVVGGLMVSTVMTLLVVPVHSLMVLARRVSRMRRRRICRRLSSRGDLTTQIFLERVVAILSGVLLFVLVGSSRRHLTAKPRRTLPTFISACSSCSPADVDPRQPVDVQVVKPLRRDVVYSIALPANVSPLYQTTLYAKVSGYLKWIGPDKGDTVKKNQVLAIIDAPEVEEQYQQAIADYKIKKITYDRLSNVLKETPDVIAKQDVDVSEAARKAPTLMEQRVALRDYTKVRAPYDGTITARFADPGALIQVASPRQAPFPSLRS